MLRLNIEPNIAGADDLYQKLIDCHDGQSNEQSMKINAKLILLLANHIGDSDIIDEAITIATAETKI